MTLRIYYSPDSDVLIADDVAGLAQLRTKVEAFLKSQDADLLIDADTGVGSEPYERLLHRLRFSKSDGPLNVTYSPTEGLI